MLFRSATVVLSDHVAHALAAIRELSDITTVCGDATAAVHGQPGIDARHLGPIVNTRSGRGPPVVRLHRASMRNNSWPTDIPGQISVEDVGLTSPFALGVDMNATKFAHVLLKAMKKPQLVESNAGGFTAAMQAGPSVHSVHIYCVETQFRLPPAWAVYPPRQWTEEEERNWDIKLLADVQAAVGRTLKGPIYRQWLKPERFHLHKLAEAPICEACEAREGVVAVQTSAKLDGAQMRPYPRYR